jgi:ribosomal RNA assembly protein
MIEELRIPHARIGVLIGPKGTTKHEIEVKTGVSLEIDSEEGTVAFLQTTDPIKALKAMKIVKAIGRGFSPQKALRILEENVSLELIDLKEKIGKSTKAINTKKGRIIGRQGKARAEIEENTGASISVYGKTIAIIGTPAQIDKATRAIEMLLEGAKHLTVFRFVHKQEPKKFEL